MKSKFKVIFMPGMHAATCDRTVLVFLFFLGGGEKKMLGMKDFKIILEYL